jgi:hypothetical protein
VEIIKKYKNSIYLLEFEDKQREGDLLTEKQYLHIKLILNQRFDSLPATVLPHEVKVHSPLSHQVATRLGEYYLYNGDTVEAQFWI